MKGLKLSLVIMAAALVTIGLSGMAYAFHSGGVADCDGCHTMHNSLGGKAVALKGGSTKFVGQNFLLQGTDQSSTCLNCHATNGATPSSYHIMTYPITSTPGTPPIQRTPGGDFGWLVKAYPAVGHAPASPGTVHGHQIVAADYGLLPDTTLTTAPGGTYLSANLYCTSCHNPHSSTRIVCTPVTTSCIVTSALGTSVPPIIGSGSSAGQGTNPYPTSSAAVGVYRLLGGVNYVPYSYTGGPAFINPPPIAIAPSTYNQTEATNEVRVAYGTIGGTQYGMAEWCANCHLAIYNNQPTGSAAPHIHPNGVAAALNAQANMSGTLTTYEAIYNAYVYSGNLTGTVATSYTSLVPYEEAVDDLTVLSSHASSSGGYLQGTTAGTEHVMCLTCHRAHASGFNQGTRWNNNAEFLTVAGLWPDSANTASSGYSNGMPLLDYQAAMYDRPSTKYASYQRTLCNKCHGKD
jgi:hypothetical protein